MTATLLLTVLLLPGVELRPVSPHLQISLSDKKAQACQLEYVNRSDVNVQVWVTDFWNNHKVEFRTKGGGEVLLTDLGVLASKAFQGGSRDRNFPVIVRPGKSVPVKTPRLPDYFVLKPGEYAMTVTYSDMNFDSPMQLTTKKIAVNVVE
jgi:hypothetical protein